MSKKIFFFRTHLLIESSITKTDKKHTTQHEITNLYNVYTQK